MKSKSHSTWRICLLHFAASEGQLSHEKRPSAMTELG
jgi:hypothetical protein